jgi:hypothetical protein
LQFKNVKDKTEKYTEKQIEKRKKIKARRGKDKKKSTTNYRTEMDKDK